MPQTYLNTGFNERAQVKALGARWDSSIRKWFVPDGLDLAPFSKWLPAEKVVHPKPDVRQVFESHPSVKSFSVPVSVSDKGVTLSTLLNGIAQAVGQAYRTGVWTKVEVAKIDFRNGHVYLELAERNPRGDLLAQARAVMWASTANSVIPRFEGATGAVLSAGIKLLVRAKPSFHTQFGFSLVIEEIDPDYTLGDLEAKKRDIRARLAKEGLFDANRALPPPWDYTNVLVIAPQGAAGLGDFQAEANRLQQRHICNFHYVYSRFQGEGAASEIRDALFSATSDWEKSQNCTLDAVAIIRGGGAVNDLAWLNDYGLTKAICQLSIPVLVGVGHERDSTTLDEVANQKFDTPSKVILGIEQQIRKRATEAQSYFQSISLHTERAISGARNAINHSHTEVKTYAQQSIATAKRIGSELISDIKIGSVRMVNVASESSQECFMDIKLNAHFQLSTTKATLPNFLTEVRLGSQQTIQGARITTTAAFTSLVERTSLQVLDARSKAIRTMGETATFAREVIKDASTQSEALLREVSGQGPSKTLSRGFAIIRGQHGTPVTSVAQLARNCVIEIQFRDGFIPATIKSK